MTTGCEDVYWIWFQHIFGIGSRRSELMADYFEHPGQIYEGIKAKNRVAGMLTAQELAACDSCFERAREIERVTLKKGVSIITPSHEDYPALLRQIYAKPAALYVKGDLGCLKGVLAIAMVGSRRHTEYGKDVAALIARGLVRGGAVVVSGLAHGIDTECHMAALNAGGKSVGVLGCGIDVDYPKGNAKVKRLMSENGAVITEYPLGTKPGAWNFPFRNRIVSGMCHGVAVVEADIDSGSLLTAHHAAEQGRDVFAVPGSVFSQRARGTHRLIREGAKLTETAEDIFEEYEYLGFKRSIPEEPLNMPLSPRLEQEPIAEPEPQQTRREPPVELGETARAVYAAIGPSPATAEEISATVDAAGFTEVLSALTELEIYGLIQGYPGRKFGLIPDTQ
jgi:DNA processing protein